jgi:hypothetical protein
MRRHLLQRRDGGLVIGELRIAQLDIGEVRLRQARFEIEYRLRGLLRGGFRRAGELEHLRHVLEVFRARVDEALLGREVVIAVGESEAGGVDAGDDLGGIVIVRRRADAERPVDLHLVQPRDRGLQIRARLDRGDVGEIRLDRFRPELVDALLVHARAVKVGDLLIDRALRPVAAFGEIVEDRAQLLLAQLTGSPAPAPALHRRRNRIRRAPRAVRVIEKVRAGVGVAVDVVDEHTALRSGRLRDERGGEEQRSERGDAHRRSIRIGIWVGEAIW